jgi:hypothetical protein
MRTEAEKPTEVDIINSIRSLNIPIPEPPSIGETFNMNHFDKYGVSGRELRLYTITLVAVAYGQYGIKWRYKGNRLIVK